MAEYNFLEKVLHHIALGNTIVPEACFNFEKLVISHDIDDVLNIPHIFVSGLARAGTTIIFKALYNSGQYKSLTYQHMPFILSPNIWMSISRYLRKKPRLEERSHGDGIKISFESPEAFEEVFWKTLLSSDYIKSDRLIPEVTDSSTGNLEFQKYVSLILYKAQKPYLSKNNNNILRINTLRKTFPRSHIIIPFRNPLDHATSLLEQHVKLCKNNKREDFHIRYMDYLGHHEFGPNHKPFYFDHGNEFDFVRFKNRENINYWLGYWIHVHKNIILKLNKNCHLICYESLCSSDTKLWESFCYSIGLDVVPEAIFKKSRVSHLDTTADQDLIREAESIYERMLQSKYSWA